MRENMIYWCKQIAKSTAKVWILVHVAYPLITKLHRPLTKVIKMQTSKHAVNGEM